jgi:hypothetical protein
VKVEAGESLILSWLRHVKGCQIVQLNWKPSVDRWKIHDATISGVIAEEMRQHFLTHHNLSIFAQGDSFQLIRQGEIDVLGLHRTGQGDLNLYGIDSANHTAGLRYSSDRNKNVCCVLKKLVRSAISVHGFFPGIPGEIIFAAPKVDRQSRQMFDSMTPEINEILSRHDLPLTTRVICNQEYATDIIEPVLNCMDEIKDTSELFLRSVQLANFANRARPAVRGRAQRDQVEEDPSRLKIGLHVQETVKRMINKEQIPVDEIERLQRKDYSATTFGLSYPFFGTRDPYASVDAKQNYETNKSRYYVKPYVIGDRSLYLCNYWFDPQRGRFDTWADKMQRLSASHGNEVEDVAGEDVAVVSDLYGVAVGD